MKFEINVNNIPEESFKLTVRQATERNCKGASPDWVTDATTKGVNVFLDDVMMQAGRHFADRINGNTVTGGTPRKNAMAVAWTIGSMVRPYVTGSRLKVEDPGDPDVKRLCSEIYGVGLGLEMLRACRVIDARTIRKVANRFDFEAFGPNGGSLVRIEAKGTFNNVSSSKHRTSIAQKITALGQAKRYDRAIGLITSLWTGNRQGSFDIEIRDPERKPDDHFAAAVREVIRFYARRFDEAVGNKDGVAELFSIANDPELFSGAHGRLASNLGTSDRPSRRFWRAQLLTRSTGGDVQHFLGAFWERHMLPVPLSLDVQENAKPIAYMGVDARILDLIARGAFRELMEYKPRLSGIMGSRGEGFQAIFHLDDYGVIRGLVAGELPREVDLVEA